MKVFFSHYILGLKIFLRQPAYVVSTLIFPGLFFLFFALPNADTVEKANFLLGSFSIFAVLGVIFFQFGVFVAQDKDSLWMSYQRSLPVSFWTILAARGLVAMTFGFLAFYLVSAVVFSTTDASIGWEKFIGLNVILFVLCIPFCAFALLLGLTVSANSILPVCNLIYLLSSFAGGLWMPPNALPEAVKPISEWLPTRAFGEVVWSYLVPARGELGQHYPIVLVLFTFIIVAYFIVQKVLKKLTTSRPSKNFVAR